MKPFLLLAGLALASPPFTASAEAPTPPSAEVASAAGATAPRSPFARDVAASHSLFDRLDTDGDGYLSQNELTSPEALSASWIAIDRNQDGKISREEFTALAGGGVATRQP